jgi:hypothetical protein
MFAPYLTPGWPGIGIVIRIGFDSDAKSFPSSHCIPHGAQPGCT